MRPGEVVAAPPTEPTVTTAELPLVTRPVARRRSAPQRSRARRTTPRPHGRHPPVTSAPTWPRPQCSWTSTSPPAHRPQTRAASPAATPHGPLRPTNLAVRSIAWWRALSSSQKAEVRHDLAAESRQFERRVSGFHGRAHAINSAVWGTAQGAAGVTARIAHESPEPLTHSARAAGSSGVPSTSTASPHRWHRPARSQEARRPVVAAWRSGG